MSESVLLTLRVLKFASTFAFVSGVVGTLVTEAGSRGRFAYQIAGPGFGLTWVFGFLLAYFVRAPLYSTWILGALVLTMTSLQATLWLAGKPQRSATKAAPFLLLPLLGTLTLMILRP